MVRLAFAPITFAFAFATEQSLDIGLFGVEGGVTDGNKVSCARSSCGDVVVAGGDVDRDRAGPKDGLVAIVEGRQGVGNGACARPRLTGVVLRGVVGVTRLRGSAEGWQADDKTTESGNCRVVGCQG